MQRQIPWKAYTASIPSITTNGFSQKMDRWVTQPTLPVRTVVHPGDGALRPNHKILIRRVESSHRSRVPGAQHQRILGNRDRPLLDLVEPSLRNASPLRQMRQPHPRLPWAKQALHHEGAEKYRLRHRLLCKQPERHAPASPPQQRVLPEKLASFTRRRVVRERFQHRCPTDHGTDLGARRRAGVEALYARRPARDVELRAHRSRRPLYRHHRVSRWARPQRPEPDKMVDCLCRIIHPALHIQSSKGCTSPSPNSRPLTVLVK